MAASQIPQSWFARRIRSGKEAPHAWFGKQINTRDLVDYFTNGFWLLSKIVFCNLSTFSALAASSSSAASGNHRQRHASHVLYIGT